QVYALWFWQMYGNSTVLFVFFLRAWTVIDTHTIWLAISVASLVYVKGNNPLKSDYLFNANFLKLFAVPVILHAIWDMPLYFLHKFNLLFIIIIVIGWVFIFSFIHVGLKQIGARHLNNS